MPLLAFKSRNIMAMQRKPLLKHCGVCAPWSSLNYIDDISQFTSVTITGTQDGLNYTFSLPNDSPVLIIRNGLTLKPGLDYSISGSTLTFLEPPLADDIILAITMSIWLTTSAYQPSVSRLDATGVKNGSNLVFTISPGTNLTMIVWEGKVLQQGVDYSLSGTTLTLVAPPQVGDTLEVITW